MQVNDMNKSSDGYLGGKKSDHSKPREFVIELNAKERCHKLEKSHHYTSDTIFPFNCKDTENISERLKGKDVSLFSPVLLICTFDSKFVFTPFP